MFPDSSLLVQVMCGMNSSFKLELKLREEGFAFK